MIDIRDLIVELRQHPDFIAADIFTIDDVIYDLNCQLDGLDESGEFIEIGYDDLTENDISQIKNDIENKMESLWNHISPYPCWDDLTDLTKKLERDRQLSRILEK